MSMPSTDDQEPTREERAWTVAESLHRWAKSHGVIITTDEWHGATVWHGDEELFSFGSLGRTERTDAEVVVT